MSLRGTKLSLHLPLSAATFTPPTAAELNNPPPPPPPQNNPPPHAQDYFTESAIHEDIIITFTMPGGESIQQTVKTGETVQELKRKLYAAHGIPFSSLSLFFEGKCMMDPLSLNDIAGVVDKSGVAQIEVKV